MLDSRWLSTIELWQFVSVRSVKINDKFKENVGGEQKCGFDNITMKLGNKKGFGM